MKRAKPTERHLYNTNRTLTLKSTPIVALLSSSGSHCSSENRNSKLDLPTDELPISKSLTLIGWVAVGAIEVVKIKLSEWPSRTAQVDTYVITKSKLTRPDASERFSISKLRTDGYESYYLQTIIPLSESPRCFEMIVLQYYDLGDLGNRVGDSTEALELESISFGLMKLVRPRPHQFNIQFNTGMAGLWVTFLWLLATVPHRYTTTHGPLPTSNIYYRLLPLLWWKKEEKRLKKLPLSPPSYAILPCWVWIQFQHLKHRKVPSSISSLNHYAGQ